jgi:A/G-specific adenine glycosylase
VTRYPLKAKKNESKNESICVAVVSHAEDVDESIQADKAWKFLMTKRPEGGLLAGQWEFIHSKVDDSDKILAYSQRKTHMKPRLTDMFTSKTPLTASNKSLQRREVGELVHVFSHVKHHMGIEHLHFETAPSLAKTIAQDSSSVRWMTVDDMDQLGITTGVKKILQLVLKGCDATPPQSLKKTDAAKTSSKRTVNRQKPAPLKNTDQKDSGEEGAAVQVQKRSTGTARAHVTDTSLAGSAKRLKTIRSFFKK